MTASAATKSAKPTDLAVSVLQNFEEAMPLILDFLDGLTDDEPELSPQEFRKELDNVLKYVRFFGVETIMGDKDMELLSLLKFVKAEHYATSLALNWRAEAIEEAHGLLRNTLDKAVLSHLSSSSEKMELGYYSSPYSKTEYLRFHMFGDPEQFFKSKAFKKIVAMHDAPAQQQRALERDAPLFLMKFDKIQDHTFLVKARATAQTDGVPYLVKTEDGRFFSHARTADEIAEHILVFLPSNQS